jgi:hypothetical protein
MQDSYSCDETKQQWQTSTKASDKDKNLQTSKTIQLDVNLNIE